MTTTEVAEPARGRRLALFGIGAALASLFLAPPLFGIGGVALGYLAIRRGERRLGGWAIGLSIVLASFSTWLALALVHRI